MRRPTLPCFLLVPFLAAVVACSACARDGAGASSEADRLGDPATPASTGDGRAPDASFRSEADAGALGASQAVGDPEDASGFDAGSPPLSPPMDDSDARATANPDGASPDPGAPPPPVEGDLVITEVLARPSAASPASEWFEVDNIATGPRTLSGLTIEDGLGDTAVIAAAPPVVLAPGQYGVFARSLATAVATGIPPSAVVYEYGAGLADDQGIVLQAGPLGALSLSSGSTQLAYVPYGSWDEPASGQSIELAQPLYMGSALPASWCFAAYPWATGSDWGTPGAASDCE